MAVALGLVFTQYSFLAEKLWQGVGERWYEALVRLEENNATRQF